MSCSYIRALLKDSNKLIVVHHWDSDGIASAAMVANWLLEQKHVEIYYLVPKIGFYNLGSIISKLNKVVDKANRVLFLDYSLRRSELETLEKLTGKELLIVDHHRGDVWRNICNPLLEDFSEEDFPSNTYNLWRNIIQKDIVKYIYYVLIGIVGDIGRKAYDFIRNKFKGIERIDLSKLYRVVDLIDSCYRVGDYNCIERARSILIEGDIDRILEDSVLVAARDQVQSETEDILQNIKPIRIDRKIAYFELESKNYITSYVGRVLSSRNPRKIIVLRNYVRRLNLEIIYVRSFRYNLAPVITSLKSLGVENMGGKDYVFAVQCINKCEEELVDLVLKRTANAIS